MRSSTSPGDPEGSPPRQLETHTPRSLARNVQEWKNGIVCRMRPVEGSIRTTPFGPPPSPVAHTNPPPIPSKFVRTGNAATILAAAGSIFTSPDAVDTHSDP